jgi:plasmid stability protein
MGLSLSIKDVPEALAERLRARATRNHRSLQRELMAIIEAASAEPAAPSSGALVVTSPTPVYEVAATLRRAPKGMAGQATASADNLLAELDAIVAGTRWGSAPALTREQAHDRRLQRELDYDARQSEAAR